MVWFEAAGRGSQGSPITQWLREGWSLCLQQSCSGSAPLADERSLRREGQRCPLRPRLLFLASLTWCSQRQLPPWLTRKLQQLLPLLRGRSPSTQLGRSPRTRPHPLPPPPSAPRAAAQCLALLCSRRRLCSPLHLRLYPSAASAPDAAEQAIPQLVSTTSVSTLLPTLPRKRVPQLVDTLSTLRDVGSNQGLRYWQLDTRTTHWVVTAASEAVPSRAKLLQDTEKGDALRREGRGSWELRANKREAGTLGQEGVGDGSQIPGSTSPPSAMAQARTDCCRRCSLSLPEASREIRGSSASQSRWR